MADTGLVIGNVAVDQDLLNDYALASFNVQMAEFSGGLNGCVNFLPASDRVVPANAVDNPRLVFGMAATQLDVTNTSSVDSGARPTSKQGRGPVCSRRTNVGEFFDHAVRGYRMTGEQIAAELGRQCGLALAQDCKKQLIGALVGATEAVTTSTHTNDETALTTKTMQLTDIFDSKALLGDAASQLRVLWLHSLQLKSLESNLLTGSYNAYNVGDMMIIDGLAAVKGMRVIVDDDIYCATVSAGNKYHSLMLGPGACWVQPGAGGVIVTVTKNVDKGALAYKVASETHFAVGVTGMDYDMNPTNPTQAQLATTGNWAEAFSYDHKDVKSVATITLES